MVVPTRIRKREKPEKSLVELGTIARVLLNRDSDFDPSTIWSWKKNRDRIREQAMAYTKRHRYDACTTQRKNKVSLD